MKKLLLISIALAVSSILVYGQGTITINSIAPTVYTNTGIFSGPAIGSGGTFIYEVLDMTEGTWKTLTPFAQAAAYDLADNPQALSLWTDSAVSGINSTLHAGGINASGDAIALNWAAPTSNVGYNTAPNYDYYTIVGWSANVAGSWTSLANGIMTGTLPGGPDHFFGQTGIAYNYAGGGSTDLSAADLFGPSGTGLAGSGGLPTTDALTLYSIPEPATFALIGLGSVSMIFLRRRKT
ncbi:MAG TPA: PEP-CTERM sorting domain-containing protein [Pseudomonadales bacterium]|nr:PEP-CTERM sorting domain-containing protein [Pseudomonadales bacterium]